MKPLRTLVPALALLALTVTVAGCNTFHGFGKDVEKGGEKIQDVSKDAQQELREH